MKRLTLVLQIIAIVLLLPHSGSPSPVYKTASLAAALLLWLVPGIILLVKKEWSKSVIAVYIVTGCAIAATLLGTFHKVTLQDAFLASDSETITAVELWVRDGSHCWRWLPSEEPIAVDDPATMIQGGSAGELLEGLGEITAQNYWLGNSPIQQEIDDIRIYTSEGHSLSVLSYGGAFLIRGNGERLRGLWLLDRPISEYIPTEVLEVVCSQ